MQSISGIALLDTLRSIQYVDENQGSDQSAQMHRLLEASIFVNDNYNFTYRVPNNKPTIACSSEFDWEAPFVHMK